MEIVEFKDLKRIEDKNNPFSFCYELDDGSVFYVEPQFITQLENLKEMYSIIDYARVLEKMIELAKKNKKVIFTYDYEHPLTKQADFVHLELIDITDLLGIYIEDKSRGSDYGD